MKKKPAWTLRKVRVCKNEYGRFYRRVTMKSDDGMTIDFALYGESLFKKFSEEQARDDRKLFLERIK